MVYRYQCTQCKNYISLTIIDYTCPMCGGNMKLLDNHESIANPDTVIIQHIRMADGRQVLVIDARGDTRAFEMRANDWQPIPPIDIYKPYGHIIKTTARMF